MATTNPNLAYTGTTDPSTWNNGTGGFLGPEYGQTIETYQASVAVAAGDIVSFVAPTSTAPLAVKPSTTTATESYRGVGVAAFAAAAGDLVDVIVKGPAVVNVGTADPVFGDIGTFTANTTAGVCTRVDQTTYAASNFAKVVGVFLSADDSPTLPTQTTQAVIYVCPSY